LEEACAAAPTRFACCCCLLLLLAAAACCCCFVFHADAASGGCAEETEEYATTAVCVCCRKKIRSQVTKNPLEMSRQKFRTEYWFRRCFSLTCLMSQHSSSSSSSSFSPLLPPHTHTHTSAATPAPAASCIRHSPATPIGYTCPPPPPPPPPISHCVLLLPLSLLPTPLALHSPPLSPFQSPCAVWHRRSAATATPLQQPPALKNPFCEINCSVGTRRTPMIRFLLLQNRQGKTRLSKWWVPYEDNEKHQIAIEVNLALPLRTCLFSSRWPAGAPRRDHKRRQICKLCGGAFPSPASLPPPFTLFALTPCSTARTSSSTAATPASSSPSASTSTTQSWCRLPQHPAAFLRPTLVHACHSRLQGYLEAIHLFVEILDQCPSPTPFPPLQPSRIKSLPLRYFGNVCELDLVFNFNKVRRRPQRRLRMHRRSPRSPFRCLCFWTSLFSLAKCKRRLKPKF